MAARSPLFNILGEDFLTLVAKHIGDDWRTFFIDLGFETYDLPHFSHKVDSLLETILNGLHRWKENPLTDKSSKSTSIKEIFDLIIEGLELNGCRTIAEKIQSNFTSSDINKIIDLLSDQLVMDERRLVLTSFRITHTSIQCAHKSYHTLKAETKALLNNWYNDLHFKYWKCQELFTVFRTSDKESAIRNITEKFNISDISNEKRAKASNQVNSVVSVTEHKIISKKRVIEETLDVQDSGCKSKKSKYGDDIDDKLYVEDSPIDSKKSKHDDRETVEQTPNSCIVLRKYQEELAEKALQGKSTIICVVTNAGKTIVAFHIIDEHIRRNPKAKVVFMARTNPLLDQQYKKACKYLKHLQESNDIKIFLVGQESTDESARLQFDNGRLFFMTPQLLMNKMKLKEKLALPINKFSMLVLDECHHVHGKTPYNDIMATYRKAKYDEQGLKLPQIVGLTASPGTNKATDESSAQEHLINIMINMDVIHLSTVRTHTANLLEHTSEVKQVQQFLDTYMQDAKQNLQNPPNEKLEQTYIQWITETRLKVENVLNKDAYVPRLMLTYLRHLEIYAECLEMNSLLDTYEVVDLINTKISQESIQSKNANTLEEKQMSKYLNEVCIFMKSLETQQVDENPNVTTIINILEEEYKKEGDSSRFLIFVRTRVTAKALAKRLQHLKHLNCQYFTGSQVGLEDGGLTKHKQLEVIDNFKSGVHKCIVATAVASEGIDIPECTMIIRYRFTANEITSYQMKGRIRKAGGREFIIGSQKENSRERVNEERNVLMEKAIQSVRGMDEHYIEEKIIRGQKLLYLSEEVARKNARDTINNKIAELFRVHCRKCPKEIVDGNNLKILKDAHHVVFDHSILNRITRQHKEHKSYDNIELTDKVLGECGHEWGRIHVYKDCELVVLAQKSIKVYDVKNDLFLNIKKWKDVQFKIDKVDDNDILAFKASRHTTAE